MLATHFSALLTTCASRKKNGQQTRICLYPKRKMILRRIACGSPSLSYSLYVVVEDASQHCLNYSVLVSSREFCCSNGVRFTHLRPAYCQRGQPGSRSWR